MTRRRFGRFSRLWRETGYLLSGLPVAITAFMVLFSLMSASISTLVIWVGVPLLAVTLQLAMEFGRLERLRLRQIGWQLSPPPRVPAKAGKARLGRWFKTTMFATAPWRAWLFAMVSFPLAVATWIITITWWSIMLYGLTEWVWRPFVPDQAVGMSVGDCPSGSDSHCAVTDQLHLPIPPVLFDFLVAIVFALTLIPVTRVCAAAHYGLARLLLAPTQRALEKRMAELAASRDQVVAAQADELRRVEQDIHDGPQQRMIRVGMDIATAQRRLTQGDIAGAQAVLAQTRQINNQAVSELRAVARGIVPPVLADRGLIAALESICASSAVPCQLEMAVPKDRRWPAPVENACYFIAAEALANVAKHALASQARLSLTETGTGPVVSVGRGGGETHLGHFHQTRSTAVGR